MKHFGLGLGAAVVAIAAGSSVYTGCTSSQKMREPAAYEIPANINPRAVEAAKQDAQNHGGNVHFPTGLTKQEALDLWHLTEGSDVYPLAWFVKMPSHMSKMPGTLLGQNLDAKYGVIKESPGMASASRYPLKYIGLAASWSDAHPANADVLVEPGAGPEAAMGVRRLPKGGNSIAMMGVNCAFCHTSEVKTKAGKSVVFEGGPAMLNIRGFFQDIFASTAKTMLTPELMEKFLVDMKVKGDTRAIASEFSNGLLTELGLNTWKSTKLGPILNYLDNGFFEQNKTKTLRKTFFEKRDVVEKYLVRMLQITYGMREVSPELRIRMKWLAISIGGDPDLATTPEGYSRTDAFGRIANWVARTKNPIPLTATSSVPSMWNIEYRAQFHWNANTNSVVMRNLGQSFGLGSVLTNQGGRGLEAFDATSNLHNLHRLESLLYKIQSPRWEQLNIAVDKEKVRLGCEVYHKSCVKCHEPQKTRVGPTKQLVLHKVIPMHVAGTDEVYSKNQSIPVDGVPFKDALFQFTGKVRDRYYQRFNIPPAEQAEWERRNLRGEELFRDTYVGESGHTGDSSYMNIPANPRPGYPARQLGSVWATAPYLHNGSVPDVWELLKPSSQRKKMFFVGSNIYDPDVLGFRSEFDSLPPIKNLEAKAQALLTGKNGILMRTLGRKMQAPRPANIWEAKIQVACREFPERCFWTDQTGNSNKGHEGPLFGTNLPEGEKRSLIEFMKVLRPEPEYAYDTEPVYSWNGQSCQVY